MSPATAHGPANGRTGAERPMVEAHHVRKSFGRLEVLKGIDLEVPRGTVTCLIGPSGSGSRRCCAASITWSRSTPVACTSTAS